LPHVLADEGFERRIEQIGACNGAWIGHVEGRMESDECRQRRLV